MTIQARVVSRAILSLGLAFAAFLPLGAQLDPRLQATKTDFLDLYQKSTSTPLKPEVVTVFDFSGSMAASMFHPQYVNLDRDDNNAKQSLAFTLVGGTTAVAGSNTYTITATAHGCPAVKTTYSLTVNSNGTVGINTGTSCTPTSTYTITAKASYPTNGTIPTAIANFTVGTGITSQSNNVTTGTNLITQSNGTTTSNPITVSPATYSSGTLLTFTTYLKTSATQANRKNIIWSSNDGSGPTTVTTTSGTSPYKSTWTWTVPSIDPFQISNINTTTTTFTAGTTVTFNASLLKHNGSDTVINWTASNGTSGSGTSWNWTVPAYDPGTPATSPHITSSLNADGVTSGPTFIGLVTPTGTLVDENLADTSKSDPTQMSGYADGKLDVRNWVRAASHARFSAMVGTDLRTIDIPIPWKLTDANSSGNPLSSRTVKDQVVRKSVTYGSGLQIELDRCYTLTHGDEVLDPDNVTTTLLMVTHRQDYMGWLFTGKYANGSYSSSPAKYIVYDAANANLAGGQGNVSWGQGWGAAAKGNLLMVPKYNDAGVYQSESLQDASANILPGMSRVQAVKRAAIETWIQNQASVLWAFRFLDSTTEASSSNTSTIHNNSATTLNTTAGVPTTAKIGEDSGWQLLNNLPADGINATSGNSVTNMKRIATFKAGNSTPLTYAVANALAQLNDPNNVFKTVETGGDAPSACMSHFLIVFTDGNDNNGDTQNLNANATTPYLVNGVVSPLAGNQQVILHPTYIDRTGTWWNSFTFAAMAAHLTDTSLGTALGADYLAATAPAAATSATPHTFMPFAIKKRGTVDFGTYGHRVTTMTLGVSLGGYYNDNETTYSISGKRALFRTALLGDPTITSGNATDYHGFDPATDWLVNPADPADYPEVGLRKAGATYFFDGSDPEKLALMLQRAIQSTLAPSNINSTSNPNLPFIGASLGKQVYLGKFTPPATGGPIWSGDLLMFATREANNQTQIIDNSGNVVTTLDSSTAQWSAFTALRNNRYWYQRKLYTRLPGDGSTAEKGLIAFSDTGTVFTALKGELMTKGPDGTTSPSTGPYPSLPRTPTAATDSAKQAVVQKAMGADLTSPADATTGRPTLNRSSIMGDIVDSSPAAIPYTVSSTLAASIAANTKLSLQTGDRFRLVLTGTNQGWLHAFGEISRDTAVTDKLGKTLTLVKGAVDELWAFMPTDFLGQLDYVFGGSTGNAHRFMVDGAPLIYHLDMPPSSGGSGNGAVDSTERAIAIIGLRKGGRSYYAIDIHDPFSPTLKWSLCPDEAAYFDGGRILSGGPDLVTVKAVLAKMGFSTATPALGRVLFNGIVKDAVFFSGGFTTDDVDANFKDSSGTATKLGRSVLALDVYTGEVLAAVDMTTIQSGIACIPAGLIPFEFFPNSGMAQRAYFLDYGGGLWSWGSGLTSGSGTYTDYRIDTSDLAKWTTNGIAGSTPSVRKVAQDGSGNGAKYTTLPAPFRVGGFLGLGKSSGSTSAPTPAAVGVAMISGDRNNPVDTQYTSGVGSNRPAGHRVTVVFDRQDSKAWSLDSAGILDSKLINLTTQAVAPGLGTAASNLITPGTSTFYLTNSGNPYFGYYLSLPATGASPDFFIPKGISEPMVVSGSLFYSYFTPTTLDVCSGGDGITYSNMVCDVYRPMATDSRTTVSCVSGNKTTWSGVASTFSAYGTRGVIQGGAVAVANPALGASKTTLDLKTILGAQQQRFPKVRVWRTVH